MDKQYIQTLCEVVESVVKTQAENTHFASSNSMTELYYTLRVGEMLGCNEVTKGRRSRGAQ